MWSWCDRAYFNKSEAHRAKRFDALAVFVEPCC
ncbi:Uncharacterised protein [Vibrio cholerae]|nr:Uncharacterised protein [Vibrio cholerae]